MKGISHLAKELYLLLAILSMVKSDLKCTGFKKCCSGYLWNETLQDCIKCRVGYYAKDCKFTCPYPSYGDECQGICKCTKILCDFVRGCKDEGTSTTVTTFPVSTLTSHETPTLSLMQDIAETDSFSYKWLFFGTIALCLLLGSCVVVLLIKLVFKKRANADVYQHTLPSTTSEILHVYESCESNLHQSLGDADNITRHVQRSVENIYLSVIDNASNAET